MKAEPTLRFLPLTDGKTPLFMWVMMPVFKVISDPLLAGRMVAVFSGLGTLFGIFIIGRIFFNRRIALIGAFLIAITPYMIFFDRMALVDTMLAAFVTWSILLGLLVVKYKRIDLAMVLGYFLGGGLLTKTPGMFNVVMVPLTVLTLNFKAKDRATQVLKVAGLFIISIAIGLGIYNLLRLGPGFSSLNSRNSDYVRNPMDLLKNPLDPFLPHFRDLSDLWPSLLGYPVILAILIGIFFAFYKRNKYAISIFLIGLGPLLIQMFLLQTFTGRYMLFSIPPFLLIASYGLYNLTTYSKKGENLLSAGLAILLLIWPVYFTYKLTTDIENTPLAKNERRGYLEDWTAGYGFKEIASYIEEESKKGLVIIGTEGSFGTLPDGLQIYFDKNRNVVFKPGKSSIPDELFAEASKSATFFVANSSRFISVPPNVELIQKYPKAMPLDSKFKQDSILFFKILPNPEN